MAFCGRCGAQLEGSERFCVKCGAAVTTPGAAGAAASAAAPAAAPVAAAQAPRPVAVPPPVAPTPVPYAAPGQIPMSVAIPPQAPAKKSGMAWLAVLIALGVGGYYYYQQHPQGQPGTTPATAPQPGNPGNQPGPYGTPAPSAPVQPGDPGPGGADAALVQMQAFNGSWRALNGYDQIYDGHWVNHSNETMASSILECDQYDQSGDVLSQQRTTLNGPVQAGGTGTYNPFNMGQIMQGLVKVNCGIVAVTPAQ